MSERICSIDGCDRPFYGRELCRLHYQRWWTHGTPHAPGAFRQGPVCEVADCDKKPLSRNLCAMHYQRLRSWGTTDYAPKPRTYKRRRVGVDPCEVPGCERPLKARGWCAAHYSRWQRHGSPTAQVPGEVVDGKRICPGCGEAVPVEEWYVAPATGRYVRCRECYGEWNRDRQHRRRAGADEPRFTRAEVAERDGWTCGICSDAIDPNLSYPDPMSMSLDHIVPLSRGGSHSLENCQVAHFTCNMRKHARLPVT